ncbi:hypothetical protein GCM10010339_83310 [Streptomyces alanosinicus]|uniref:Chaplin n=1 Tax=Streptomyces alanosinicus TaxID=68171 RepID=A0A918YRN4_9ACTN|nr:hypothetical protein GCM10010339_83310 [Streptomyces alanosinicus]
MDESKGAILRVFTVSAAMAMALVAGSATATSAMAATLAPHVATKDTGVRSPTAGRDADNCVVTLQVPLCMPAGE